MRTVLYCFRDDLRLHDNPALLAACQRADRLLPVWLAPAPAGSAWGFARVGERRRAFRARAAAGLDAALRWLGSRLIVREGTMAQTLPQLAEAVNAAAVFCEDMAMPEEVDELDALRNSGLEVHSHWQSTLFAPDALPWKAQDLPDVFTVFRQNIERSGLAPLAARAVEALPPLPDAAKHMPNPELHGASVQPDPRSSFPFPHPAFQGGEAAALAHLEQYLMRNLPHSYKDTRNGLHGVDYSSKFSPWLACGALSARHVAQRLREFEAGQGASEGSYWLWFELLWRDYFKLLQLKYGKRLYRAGGLPGKAAPPHDEEAFQRWRAGATGQPLVDAGMRELAATGYLGNRMRQIVAGYLVHDLQCDWRAGAAWFESALIDYDCSLNHGNWLYIAGLGTDPRGGRRFNLEKQAAEHDTDGAYRALWSAA
ncbi:DASH family cryptochrome [Massilia sp. SR12]